MLTKQELFHKYKTTTQGLFAEVEIYLVGIPSNALNRIVDFSDAMAAYETAEGKEGNIYLQNADTALNQANCHCHKLLTEEYQRLANKMRSQYGEAILKKVDNGAFYEDITEKEALLIKKIDDANRVYEEKRKQIIQKDSTYSECIPGSVQEDELTAKIAESPDVQNAFEQAYLDSKRFYELFMNDENRVISLDNYKDHEERLQNPKEIADKFGNVAAGIGFIGIIVFIFRKLMGI